MKYNKTLQVTKEDAGNYTCQAFNVEGHMQSLPQSLDILCRASISASSYHSYDHITLLCASFHCHLPCFPNTCSPSDRPFCLTDQKMIYGVSEQETAHISCTVASNPKADSFFWTLNNTAGHAEIPGAMSTDMAGASLLSYRPMSQACSMYIIHSKLQLFSILTMHLSCVRMKQIEIRSINFIHL